MTNTIEYELFAEFGKIYKRRKTTPQKKKSHFRKLLRRSLSSNIPSRKNDSANIQINRETAIDNLKNLEKDYTNIEQLYGFLRNIKLALGLQPAKGASEYGIVEIPQDRGRIPNCFNIYVKPSFKRTDLY